MTTRYATLTDDLVVISSTSGSVTFTSDKTSLEDLAEEAASALGITPYGKIFTLEIK